MRYRGICNQINQLDHYTTLAGGNKNIIFHEKIAEIKADIILESMYGTTVWGYLQDSLNQPLIGKKISLVKMCTQASDGKEWFETVEKTYTDENGFYMMEACVEACETLHVIIDTTTIEGVETDAYVIKEQEVLCEKKIKEDPIVDVCKKNYVKGIVNRSCTNYIKFYGDNGGI